MQILHLNILYLILAGLCQVKAFIAPRFKINSAKLFAATGDPLDAIRARMASDPNFDPLKDPQTMQILESKIPPELRDASNSVERLRVALKDAVEGTDAISDLDAAAAKFGAEGLISSPQSTWFKENQPNEKDGAFSEAKKQELFNKLKGEYPEVPLK